MEHDQAMEIMAAEKYALGELRDEDREQFEEHFFSCVHCAQDVKDLCSIADGVKELLKPETNPEPSQERSALSWLPRWIFPGAGVDPLGRLAWAGALLALLGVAGYENFAFRQAVRPQAIASIVVHAESRGEATPVPVERLGAFLLLEAELPESSGTLQWNLRKIDSKAVVLQDSAAAPPPGETFKVLLPSSFLTPAEYTLTVREPAVNPERVWSFRFKVKPKS